MVDPLQVLTPEQIKALSTPDIIKKMNELLVELDARTAKQGGDDARRPAASAPPISPPL
jgi:hypothetical protein